jgi:hypothetical protein
MELQQQIEDITQYLADYDLKWVGGPPPHRPNNPPDRVTFLQKIEYLNRLADRSKLEFTQSGNISTISPIPKLKLRLYEQGFIIDYG